MTRSKRTRSCPVLVPLLLSSIGCSVTQSARQVTESGFLADYSRLHKGSEDQAELVYIRSGVPWKSYSKMLLDPGTVWRSVEVGSKGISPNRTPRPWPTTSGL